MIVDTTYLIKWIIRVVQCLQCLRHVCLFVVHYVHDFVSSLRLVCVCVYSPISKGNFGRQQLELINSSAVQRERERVSDKFIMWISEMSLFHHPVTYSVNIAQNRLLVSFCIVCSFEAFWKPNLPT